MIKSRFWLQILICVLVACGCSVEVSPVGETPQVEQTPLISSTANIPVTQVPVTWAHLNLSGRLVYLTSAMQGDKLTSSIQMLDLATGGLSTILNIPSAWVYYATVSPAGKMLVMSYAPPQGSSSSSSRSLYILPIDASTEPELLFPPPTTSDRYTQAEWSPDGKSIYYVHYNQEERPPGQFYEDFDIYQLTYPEGEHTRILEHAFWPRVSPDSSRLVYVSLDPESGLNELFIANADGSQPQPVPLSGAQPPQIIDAPIFSPDGQSILFSAPPPIQSRQPNFLERLAGIQIANAHNVPSDWWSVPITGGVPTRLTNLQTINLFASISPDQQHLASLSGEGIFIMDLDGSNLTQLVSDPGVHGTISWIP
jgi:Tol biopolymer transport system component